MRVMQSLKKILPRHSIPAHLLKDDQEAISLFEKEWSLQKKWLLATGWCFMTALLIPLGILLDTGIIHLPGRSSSLSYLVYIMLISLSVALALASIFVRNMLNLQFKTVASQKQLKWAAEILEIEIDDMPKGLTLGALSDRLKQS